MTESTKKFSKWLDNLQQESWQLELIVSGFVIFGLFQTIEPLKDFFNSRDIGITVGFEYAIYSGMIGFSVILSVHLLLFNLILHLILRGLWIGAVGLRYYSGDIDYDQLNYTEKFKKYLNKKIGSFDDYIKRLEDYCSIIFSLSFLLVFIFFSFAVIISLLLIPATLLLTENNVNASLSLIIGILLILFLLMVLLTAIDFLGQGILKKNKVVAKLYFPIYWLMSYISLSFLYRPILYNFLDNKNGRRILFWLFPFYIGVSIISTLSVDESNFHDYKNSDSPNFILSEYYLDKLKDEEYYFFNGPAIESKLISNSAIQLFLPHTALLEDAIIQLDSTIAPEKDQRGIKSELFLSRADLEKNRSKDRFNTFLTIINDNTFLKINNKVYKTDFLASRLITMQRGYETFLPLDSLESGRHLLQVTSKLNSKKELDTIATIPFWYFPE